MHACKMSFKIKRGAHKLPVKICEEVEAAADSRKIHGPLLPSTIRCIICGPSNCGKTSTLLTLLTHPNGLRYKNLYIYSRSLHQPKYVFLENVIKLVPEMKYYAFGENQEIMDPNQTQPNSVFVFDDVSCENQQPMRKYFSMGRHHQVDCFYLCQSYARVPKHLLRDNANMLIVFKQDDLNLKKIYSDHVSGDMNFQKFYKMCVECWKTDYGFLTIDKDCSLKERGRYRKDLDGYIVYE